ncbi:MAG: Zn-dependent hydrolase of the beta-lactamase fold-like protein [Microgenomates bacterium 39_6]|nr:MAG: Zn-dependent hydrolase of the beta-lactamase fold-like protein [Microgenomates bacterium 39_6]
MEIWYLGFGSFRIRTKRGIIVTDPYDPKTNLKMPQIKPDLITISRPSSLHNNSQAFNNQAFVIKAPGEYEIGGINILGVSSYRENSKEKERSDNTIYLFHTGGIRLVHLGQLNHPLSKDSLTQLDSPDILFLPLGEKRGLTAKYATEIARQLQAKIIFPIHYIEEYAHSPLNKIEVINKFLKEMGNTAVCEPKLIVSKSGLDDEEEKVVLLENRGK